MTSSVPSQLAARSLSFSHGAVEVLRDVSLRVTPRSRIGLLGPNGVGKSTLLQILAGLVSPGRGAVERSPASMMVGYLSQEPGGDTADSLGAYLARRTGVASAVADLDAASRAMTDDLVTIQRYSDALDRLDRLGGYDFESRAAAVATELGFRTLEVRMERLSGGQRTRAALAAIELARFDVLLLDEPTNNLDLGALERLEALVRGSQSGIVVVSHDRAFLDATVSRFVELDPFTRTATEFAGTWSDYVRTRELSHRRAMQAHQRAVDERRRLQRRAHAIRREAEAGANRAKRSPSDGDKAILFAKVGRAQGHAVKAAQVERRIDRIRIPDKPRERWELHLDLTPATHGSDIVVRLTHAVVRRGAFTLGPLDLDVARGDRIALVGPNGSGKSTLLNVMLGDLSLDGGGRSVGPGTILGVLDQDRDAFRSCEDLTSMFTRETGVRGAEARSLLAKFELGAEDVLRAGEELSPGERTRAALAVLSARRTNCLLLDEPTNHLDLAAIEGLEHALSTYRGTLVIATHDRRLLETIGVTRTIDLG